MTTAAAIAGQLNAAERRLVTEAIVKAPRKPRVVLEVGTWLGGGSTLHLLRALEQNGEGHLWGIEADRAIYERMLANIGSAAPEALHRFTPLFGFSDVVIPKWLAEQGNDFLVDVAFLDGGDNPLEQITEFRLLDARIPVGGQLLSHDAKLRKGRWVVPYLSALDNWSAELHDVSEEGLFHAHKLRASPSPESLWGAEKELRRLRANPVERLGAFLPQPANAFLLRFLPGRLIRRITQGRR
ncbi:MAG: class I SAM-dependent methyltransferase [Chthoniobacterales bacterium]|nr:class I SAM-dependent methyltransferase [Chthoniobacterales bacterium]